MALENEASPAHHNFQLGGFDESQAFWKRLWGFHVPKRALHFAWRLITDSLPTVENLRKKTLDIEVACQLCLEENGSPEHLFFECQYARDAWSSVGLSVKIIEKRKTRGSMWFREALRDPDNSFCELVIIVCDGIWFQRNRQLFNQTHSGARDMAAGVVVNLQRFMTSQGWHDNPSESLLPQSLLRPPESCHQVFCDAGILDRSAGTGAVAFDPQYQFARATSRRFHVRDPFLAEALAMEEAISLAQSLHLTQTCIVGDALSLVQMIRGELDCPVELSSTANRIKSQLENSCILGHFWVPRDLNNIAHSLAEFAKTSPLLFNVWDTPPSFVSFASGRFQNHE